MTEVLAIIPARGGSKGVPGKNIRPLNGKPLLAYTIEQARQTPQITGTVVSTDNPEIGRIATQYGAEVIWRPSEISGDMASSESALLHTLDFLAESAGFEPELVVFLQCTSPIRRPDDINQAISTILEQQADSLVSVVRVVCWLWRMADGEPRSFNYDYQQRLRRQERPAEYNENGSIYIFKPWVLRQFNNRLGGKVTLYEMDEWSNIDIETLADFELAEWVLSRQE